MLTILICAPVIFFSGMCPPPEGMPAFTRPLLDVSPLHHYIALSFEILLKAAGLRELWPALAWLTGLGATAFGATAFGLGLWRMGRRF